MMECPKCHSGDFEAVSISSAAIQFRCRNCSVIYPGPTLPDDAMRVLCCLHQGWRRDLDMLKFRYETEVEKLRGELLALTLAQDAADSLPQRAREAVRVAFAEVLAEKDARWLEAMATLTAERDEIQKSLDALKASEVMRGK